MKFRNLTPDDRFIVGVGLAPAGTAAPHEDGPVGEIEPGEPFDLPEGFDVARIAHQDIYEPADDEAKAVVEALLAQIADESAKPADDASEPVKLKRGRVAAEHGAEISATGGAIYPHPTEQENN